MNQRGIAPAVLAAIIAGVILLAGGTFLLFAGNSDQSSNSETAETANTPGSEQLSDSPGDFTGSYFDAIGRGDPVQCKWRVPEELAGEFQVGEGDFYTDGVSRGRSDATFQNNGANFAAHSILTSDAVYNWTELPGGSGSVGFKLPRADLEAASDDLSPQEQQQAQEIRAQYSFNCQPWTVDESKFELPAGVTFSEV